MRGAGLDVLADTPTLRPARYATIALRSGVHPKIVSTRLSHATVAFTPDTYSTRKAAEDIGGLFLPPATEDEP